MSRLYFDNEEDAGTREQRPDPEQRAMVKPWRAALVEWLESRPELGAIDVTTCVSGICYIRCALRKPEDDPQEGDYIRFTIERD